MSYIFSESKFNNDLSCWDIYKNDKDCEEIFGPYIELYILSSNPNITWEIVKILIGVGMNFQQIHKQKTRKDKLHKYLLEKVKLIYNCKNKKKLLKK